MFAICRDGTRYLQKHGSRYEWVTTKHPEYFLTRNDILLISITVEGDSYARAFIAEYNGQDWQGICTPLDIAVLVAACHKVPLADVKFVGDDGKTYDFYIEDGTSEVFRMIFETIPHGLSDINRRLDAMNTELDGVDNDDND